jgi:hypothetical protein
LTIKGEEVCGKPSDSQLAYDLGLETGDKVCLGGDKKKLFSYHLNNKYKEDEPKLKKMILPSYMKPPNWRCMANPTERESLQHAGKVLGLTKQEIISQKRELLYVLRKSGFGRKHRHNYKVSDCVQEPVRKAGKSVGDLAKKWSNPLHGVSFNALRSGGIKGSTVKGDAKSDLGNQMLEIGPDGGVKWNLEYKGSMKYVIPEYERNETNYEFQTREKSAGLTKTNYDTKKDTRYETKVETTRENFH